MGKFIDFMIKMDEGMTPLQLGETVMSRLIVNRIKHNKPCVIFLTGKSGEGKSYTGLKIQEIVDKAFYADFGEMMEVQTIFTPFQYAEKIKKILHDRKYKHVRVVMIDEAREVVSSKQWYSFVVQAIPAINNLSRQIKPLVIIVISQSSKDIVMELKRSIDFYINVSRPLQGSAILKPYKLWLDDHNLEAIKQRKTAIRGYIKHNGRWEYVRIRNISVSLVDKKIRKKYDHLSRQFKSEIITTKLERFLAELSKSVYGNSTEKLEKISDFYIEHPENLNFILEHRRHKIRIKKDVRLMHDLTVQETKIFESLLLDKMLKKGLISQEAKAQDDKKKNSLLG